MAAGRCQISHPVGCELTHYLYRKQSRRPLRHFNFCLNYLADPDFTESLKGDCYGTFNPLAVIVFRRILLRWSGQFIDPVFNNRAYSTPFRRMVLKRL